MWLRAAFAGLHYDIHHASLTATWSTVNSTMKGGTSSRGRLRESGEMDTFPPTTHLRDDQSHWFRLEDGRIVEHWANRDDLGRQATRLGAADRRTCSGWRAKRKARRLNGDLSGWI